MKLIITVVLAVIVAGPTFFLNKSNAEEPQTPEEIACAPLDNPGVTKGLLGLCLAYCEAEGMVDGDVTDKEFTKNRKKSAKILKKYNKKKAFDEPDMPCLNAPCPCWTDEEMSNFGPIDYAEYPVSCMNGGQGGFYTIGYGPTPTPDPDAEDGDFPLWILSGSTTGPFTDSENVTKWICSIQDVDNGIEFRRVDGITIQAYTQCANQLIDRCRDFNFNFENVE